MLASAALPFALPAHASTITQITTNDFKHIARDISGLEVVRQSCDGNDWGIHMVPIASVDGTGNDGDVRMIGSFGGFHVSYSQ